MKEENAGLMCALWKREVMYCWWCCSYYELETYLLEYYSLNYSNTSIVWLVLFACSFFSKADTISFYCSFLTKFSSFNLEISSSCSK